MKLCVIVINYRRPELTLGCLESLVPELQGHADRCAIVVDNGSGDDSADRIEAAILERGWSPSVRLIRSPINGGFSHGNNVGFNAVNAETYLLLNSDARTRPGSIDGLLEAMERHPEAGLIGPRLEDPDGTAQISCFRYRTPITEMLQAAATGPLSRLFRRCEVAMGVFDSEVEAQWVSFACVLIRRDVIDRIGPMDEAYFMYFEDIDYARRARDAGWRIVHDPAPHVVHLRGGTSSVKSAIKSRSRVPRYYYESRSRYFAKFYGGAVGLWFANLMWLLGRSIAGVRHLVGHKQPHHCAAEARDNWVNWLDPLRTPQLTPEGGSS